MNWDVFITCAVTGAGDTTGKSPHVPITPQQIAESAIDAAKAGAAVVHIHVRDPDTGKGSRDTALNIVNTLTAQKQLPFGGSVAAKWIWNSAENLRSVSTGR